MNGPKVTIRERLVKMCNSMACRGLLMVFFLLLFCWPYLSFVDTASIGTLFAYFFGVWALLIGVLFLIGLAREDVNNDKDNA